ncbi:MAG: hypothetical protein J0M22_13025 [Gammaproteobacteria bacterium]|nr:hypothetical protein [Gammaproteobacteria bacterium]
MNNPKTQAIDQTEASKYAEILSFEPAEKVRFAVSRAKELLVNRTEDQCITIARAIDRMYYIIEFLERETAQKTIEKSAFDSVWLSQGRALFLWMDTFDLTDLGLENLEWFEVFAVRVLMQCSDYSDVKSQKLNSRASLLVVANFEYMQAKVESRVTEIVDCLARAEVLVKHGRVNTSAKLLGKKGGKARTKKIAPLESEIVKLYFSDEYRDMPVLKAANCIAVLIAETKPELLLLTKNENKPVAIQNIIRKFGAANTVIVV